MEVTLTIKNKEDILFLNKYTNSRLNEILQTAITIGLKSIQMSEVKLDCHSYIDPIKDLVYETNENHHEKLYSIESKLDDLLHIKTNSSRKGKLAEDICRDILIKNYPQWNIIDVSQTGYEADCRAIDTPVGPILYEFKNYDYNVNRDQVSKFVRDLEHTNIKYGIFVSNTSGIVGKKNIEWEIINEKLIVFVSNMGLNGYGCIIGTELLLSLIDINIMEKDKNWIYSQNYHLSDIIENISESIDNLRDNIESYTKHKELISEQRIKINNSIDILEKNSFMCLLELNETFNKIVRNTKEIVNKTKIIHNDNFDELFCKIDSDKNKELLKLLIKMCTNLHIQTDNNNLYIHKSDKLLCYTKILKSRIDLYFPINETKIISLNLKYEKLKGNEIIIELKEDIERINLIEKKLSELED